MTEFDATIRLSAAGHDPESLRRRADETELAAIAARLGLSRVARFEFTARLARLPEGDVYLATGAISMTAERICVASLEAFDETTEAEFEEYFTTSVDKASDDGDIDADSTDIELIDGDSVDLGELALQYAAMALDPHPRAPGATEIESDASSSEAAERRPFADLGEMLKGVRKPK